MTPVKSVANLPLDSTTPGANLPSVLTTLAVKFATATAGSVDIGGKFASGDKDTGGKFATGVEIIGTISDYLPLNVNLKEKIHQCLTLLRKMSKENN